MYNHQDMNLNQIPKTKTVFLEKDGVCVFLSQLNITLFFNN